MKKITMEDMGATKESLENLYVKENMSLDKIANIYNVSRMVVSKWLIECGLKKRTKTIKNVFDVNFFDEIDTEEKAYWLGFLWCDGYASTRYRGKNGAASERPVKIALSIEDKHHLETFKKHIKANHPIHVYENSSFNGTVNAKEARLTLSNMYFGGVLQDKYGMIPRRTDASKLLSSISEDVEQHFLRGLLDADGSISVYHLKSGIDAGALKSSMSFSTHTELAQWIQEYMIRNGLKDNKINTSKRHGEGSDGDCVILTYSGALQVRRLAEHIYDGATVYLQRKYDKYLKLLSELEKRNNKEEIN